MLLYSLRIGEEMKNNKTLYIFILVFISLLCFGCRANNESHQLLCSISANHDEQVITIYFNEENSKVINIKSKTTINLSNYDDDFKNQLIEFSTNGCTDSGKINCKVSVENNQVIEEYENSGEKFLNTNSKTLEEVKEIFENDGFTCK